MRVSLVIPVIAFSVLLLVPAGAQNAFAVLTFTDWTSVNTGTEIATGSIGPVSVIMSGGDLDFGVTDGSYTGFNDVTFTPPLVSTDLVGFRADSPSTFLYTIIFSSPVTDPVIHLQSLASTLTLSSPDSFTLTKLSGDTGFDVDNTLKTISGEFDDARPGGSNDRQGTAKLTGTISSLTFTADYDTFPGPPSFPEDGIFLQLGAMPIGGGDLNFNLLESTGKIGQGLFKNFFVSRVPEQAVTVHLESSDPSKALLSPFGKNVPLTSSIDLSIKKNHLGKSFSVHGISQGPVDIVATAPGFNSATETFTIVPPILQIFGLGGQQAAHGPENAFQIYVGIRDPVFIPQLVSKQGSLSVLVLSNDVGVGQVRDPDVKNSSPTSFVTKEITPLEFFIDMFFVPQDLGEVIVSASIPSFSISETVAVVPGPAFQVLIDKIDDLNLAQNPKNINQHQKDNLNRLVLKSNEHWTDGNIDFAIKAMDRLVSKIDTLERTNKISSSDAEKLIDIVKAIVFDFTPPD